MQNKSNHYLRSSCSFPIQMVLSNTHTPIQRLFSGTTQVSRYQKGKTKLDFTETRDSEWQWHQLSHMQVCTSLQTDNHASTSPLSFFTGRYPSCCPTNSIKALKAQNGASKTQTMCQESYEKFSLFLIECRGLKPMTRKIEIICA